MGARGKGSCVERVDRFGVGRAQRDVIDRQDLVLDFEPVVKLFTADGNATWLLTELNPDRDLAFGLCDLGLGEPELGYVSLHELAAARSGYPSSAISTSRSRERSRPTPILPASIGASLLDVLFQPPAFGLAVFLLRSIAPCKNLQVHSIEFGADSAKRV